MNQKYQQLRSLMFEAGIKPSTALFIGALAVAAILSLPALQKHQVKVNLVKAEIQQHEATVKKLERQLHFEKRQARVANLRYNSCLPVVGENFQNGTHYFAGLKEGDTPRDKITNSILPPGTVVCDAHGNTAVIDKNGAVTYLAFTGDRNVVQTRLKRFRGSQYSQPVVGQQK